MTKHQYIQMGSRRKSFDFFKSFLDKKIKKKLIFFIFLLKTDCGYSLEPPQRGGFNVYPQSMFLSGNNKNNVYPCKPQFYYIKVGFKGFKIINVCFRDGFQFCLLPSRVIHFRLYSEEERNREHFMHLNSFRTRRVSREVLELYFTSLRP